MSWEEGEADSLLQLSRKPHAALHPTTLGHDLSQRQMPNRLNHPGAQTWVNLNSKTMIVMDYNTLNKIVVYTDIIK